MNKKNESIQNQVDNSREELIIKRKTQDDNLAAQENFIDTLFDKGGKLLMEYNNISMENQKYSIDKDSELEKEELKVIERFDIREKWFKGILLVTCLSALILTPIYTDKAASIIPVLSFIIGLLFRSNSLTGFYSFSKKKYKNRIDEEY